MIFKRILYAKIILNLSRNITIMQINNLYSGQTDRLQTGIAWTIYFFINVIFCIKYNPFEIIHPLFLLVFYPLAVIGIYKATVYMHIQRKNYFFLILTFAILLLALFLWHHIDRWSVKVDRWSALAFWSENLKNGRFPYETPSHLGGYPSPFPIWQLFHFPFYLMGDTAYGQLFCLLIFFIALFYWRTKMNIGGIILLLVLSPGFWWEIAVRSDLLSNMLLLFVFLTALFYCSSFWDKHKILTSAITGFFLCTRLFVAIPLFLYLFPRFLKYSTKEKIGLTLMVIACFVIPFSPFLFGEHGILHHPEYNPIILQIRQGNGWVFAAGVVLLIIAALKWKNMRNMYFMAGLFLFTLVLARGVKIGLEDGWHSALFGPRFDKSYFNVCIPFFLFFIHVFSTRDAEGRHA